MRQLAAVCLILAATPAFAGAPAADMPAYFCRPGQPCWPSEAEWQQLGARVGGRLEVPRSPLAPCQADAASATCRAALDAAQNPFRLQDQAGATQSQGWLGAWTSAVSAYAVVAESAADVAAAIDFAHRHRLRLVVKGTGHDYLGRSNAPDSLLVWTHKMRQVTVHQAFVPAGCNGAAVPAVSLGAGTRWIEAYRAVTVEHGRYVQGGGCTSVGAAGGFIQGGGFGSWSKKYGVAAASMLEAEVVTADGQVRIANACQNADLFWALRGGGGGTFGVVTRVTLMTHALPNYFGFVFGRINAKSDIAYGELLERFVAFYAERLSNEHWGEGVQMRADNSLRLSMAFQGLSAAEATQVWKPLRDWVEARPERYTIETRVVTMPANKAWDYEYMKQGAPEAIKAGPAEEAARLFWWATNQEEVSTYWYAYQSRWIPDALLRGAAGPRFARVLFEASRHWTLNFHFNKGQAGAAAEALRRDRETAVNPAVYGAAGLLIIAANSDGMPGVRGHEPDMHQGEVERAKVTAAMRLIRAATPGAGAYVNETDYFEPDWKREFWGTSYPRLLAIKHKYDPDGLLYCHHCVGSDEAHAR